MFHSVLTKSLRDYRWAILAWGMGLGILVFAQYTTFAQTFAGTSTAEIRQLVSQFQFFGEAVKVSTPGGFVTFKVMGLLPIILGIWSVLAGARMTRGDEEGGALDILLSTPHSRVSVLMQKLLALAMAAALISLLMSIWIVFGMSSAGVTVRPASALLAGLNVALAALLFGALALLLAQFTNRAAAAGWAGGLMALTFVVDGTGRATHSTAALRPLSPFYYYDRNLPLVPGYSANWGALGVLTALCLVLAVMASFLFTRRDIGRTVLADFTFAPPRQRSTARVLSRDAGSVWTQGVGRQAARRQAMAMLWWVASLAIFAGYLVGVAKSSEKQFQQLLGTSGFIKQLFSGTNIGTNSGFVSILVFGYLPLLLAIFAGFMAYRWTTDLDSGRLELVLATPQPRRHVILAHYGAVLLAAVVTTVGIWLAILLVAGSTGFSLDASRVAEASIGMLPLALITASLVFALTNILPPGAVIGVLAAFLAVSYLTDLLRTLLSLPSWMVNLSMFRHYGNPIVHGLDWEAFFTMLAIAAVTLALSVWQFSIRDVERGTATL